MSKCDGLICSVCGGVNNCKTVTGEQGDCWCFGVDINEALIQKASGLESCICRLCVDSVAIVDKNNL